MQEGYEILLHGVRHNADLFIKRNPIGKLALAISHNGAEFAGLNKKLSQMLLNRSIALWKAHGFGRPSGFIAPVWLDNKHLKKNSTFTKTCSTFTARSVKKSSRRSRRF